MQKIDQLALQIYSEAERTRTISLPSNIGYEEWLELLAIGVHKADRIQWAVGDLFNLGVDMFGEEAYQAAEFLKYSRHTLETYGYVARRYGRTEREHNVPFDVYQACAGIDEPLERDNLIESISKAKEEYPKEVYREAAKLVKSGSTVKDALAEAKKPKPKLEDKVTVRLSDDERDYIDGLKREFHYKSDEEAIKETLAYRQAHTRKLLEVASRVDIPFKYEDEEKALFHTQGRDNEKINGVRI